MSCAGLHSAVLLLFMLGLAAAQELWTVQTVAFPDYRLAQAAEAELRSHGFDAYTEFTMFEGRQYSRVRIGCFSSRDGAEWLAGLLSTGFTDEAVVVPLSDEAQPAYCIQDEVGFIKPADWSIQSQDRQQIVFRVQLAGHTGYVRMRDGQWRLLTAIEPATAPVSNRSVPFEQATVAGSQVVLARTPAGNRVICPGRLLWQAGLSAVIEEGVLVRACVLEPQPDWSGQ